MKAVQVRQRATPVIDLDRYVPGYLTWISNKLSGGASQAYLTAFGTGIETWRLLVLLAIERTMSAQYACRVIGMDKASVSRSFKRMQAERELLVDLLHRLHDNLPSVEEATRRYLQQRHPHAMRKRASRESQAADQP